jgi:hypothetical protein
MRKPVIYILIPCWGRPGVFKIVIQQLDQFILTNRNKAEIKVILIFSLEDEYFWNLQDHISCIKFNHTILNFTNNYLGKKLNYGVDHIDKTCEYDYIMNLGSDDLIHPYLIDLYMPLIKKEIAVFGLNKLYFYDINKGKCLYFSYYNNPHVIGGGRMIHRRVIEKVRKNIKYLYDPSAQNCLDGNSAMRMKYVGFREASIDPGEFPLIVDIKCGTNINSLAKIESSKNRNNIIVTDTSIIENFYKGEIWNNLSAEKH